VDEVLSKKLGVETLNGTIHGLTTKVVTLKKEGDNRQQVVVVKAEGPAAEAGIKAGDVILKVNDRRPSMRF